MGIMRNLLDRRAEAPSTLAKPSSWLIEMFGGGTSKAGMTVTGDTALGLSTVWSCVRILSEDIAKLPIRITRDLDGTYEVLPRHNVKVLFNRAPNEESTAMVVREFLIANTLLWGNGFAEILRDAAGRPVGLFPLRSTGMTIKRVGGRLAYVYTSTSGKTATLDADDVFHLRGPTKDGVVGYSLITMARESFGAAMAAERFAALFWSNGGRPSGLLKHPGKLGEQAIKNLRESWVERYGGPNAHKPAVVEEGMEWVPLTMPMEDAQFLETRQFSVPEICRWFRVPPHKVSDLSRATFSNIEHQSQEYVNDSLMGWITRFEQESEKKLLLPSESDLRVRHVTAAMLRGDLKSRYEAYAIGRQNGWRTVNDVLRLEDEPTIGTEGDQRMVPSNMTTPERLGKAPLTAAADKPAAPAPAAEPAPVRSAAPADPSSNNTVVPHIDQEMCVRSILRAMRPAFEQGLDRLCRLEADKARRAHKRRDVEFRAWAQTFFADGGDHGLHVRGALFPAIEASVRTVMSVLQLKPENDRIIPDLLAAESRQHLERSLGAIAATAGAGDDPEGELVRWEKSRAAQDAERVTSSIADTLIRSWWSKEKS